MSKNKRYTKGLRKPTTKGTPRADEEEESEDEFANPRNPDFRWDEHVLIKEAEEEVFSAARRVFSGNTRY